MVDATGPAAATNTFDYGGDANLEHIGDVTGLDASTYTGKIKVQIRRSRNFKGELNVVGKLVATIKILMNLKGIKLSLFDRDDGTEKVTKSENVPTTHEGLDKFFEVVHRFNRNNYHWATDCYAHVTINKSVR